MGLSRKLDRGIPLHLGSMANLWQRQKEKQLEQNIYKLTTLFIRDLEKYRPGFTLTHLLRLSAEMHVCCRAYFIP